jgi:DNA-binding CsgD family transcriptional regulator
MGSSLTTARIRRDVLRLAYRGLDSRTLRLETIRRLRHAMPIDAFWMATADPATFLFASAVKEEIPAPAIPQFVANELLQDDVNKFRALACLHGPPTNTLYTATQHRPEASRRFREVLMPLGFGDELRAVFRSGGVPWGYACLHCERGMSGYTPEHVRLLTDVGPHVAQGLRAALLLKSAQGQAVAGTERPGLVVLAPDLSIAAATAAGEILLAELADGLLHTELPQAVQSVVGQLHALERGGEDAVGPPPRVRVRTAAGRWLLVHASRLSGPSAAGQTAVMMEPAHPGEIAPLLLDAYGLTRRETEVAQLVLRGMATEGIADALSISPLTVQQHLKSVFDKTVVGSRRELMARIFADYRSPH